MGDLIVFPLVLHSPDPPERCAGTLSLFPQVQRRALIERAARRVRSYRGADVGDYLEALAELVQDELPVGHVDQELIDNELIALIRAIQSAARTGDLDPTGESA